MISPKHHRKIIRSSPILFFIFTSLLLHLVLFFLFKNNLALFATRNVPAHPPLWVELKKMNFPETSSLPIADITKPKQEAIPEKPSAQALYNQKVAEETTATGFSGDQAQSKTPFPSSSKSLPTEKKEKKIFEELYGMKPQESSLKNEPAANNNQPRGLGFETNQDDYLPGFKVGNRTYVNTLANPRIAYFVELKNKFRTAWNPIPAIRSHATEIARGRLAVVLGVSVNQEGDLVDLVVIRSSTLERYDAEGLRTVRDSAPFTSPPSDLLGPDGLLHMAWILQTYL